MSAVITPADGLQNNEFNQNAFYLASNGTMFFGGVEGMNFFEPGSIFQVRMPLQVVLTNGHCSMKQFLWVEMDCMASTWKMILVLWMSWNFPTNMTW